jgi:hypothetical protein
MWADSVRRNNQRGDPYPNRNILMDQYFNGVFIRAGAARIAEAEVIATVLIESELAKNLS